jgi:flagella basal body P-ring formation protein FlgA
MGLMLGASSGAALGNVQIYLRSQIQVDSAELRLADVVRLEGDPEFVSLLSGISLGTLPWDGSPRRISREELRRWVEKSVPESASLSWLGNSEVQVRRRQTGVDRAQLIEVARKEALRALAPRFDGVTVEAAGNPMPTTVAAAGYTVRARRLAADETINARMVVWVELWKDAEMARAIPVALRVQAQARVLELTSTVPAGASLTERSVQVRERNVVGLDGAFWPAGEAFPALRAKRTLKAGQVLLRNQVEAVPDIERGDKVALRVRAGPVLIETSAQALNDGWLNRMVMVQPVSSAKPVQARVLAAGLVEVAQ